MFSELISDLFLRSSLKTVAEIAGGRIKMGSAATSEKAVEGRTLKHVRNCS